MRRWPGRANLTDARFKSPPEGCLDYNQTLNEIVTRLHKLGDLPVFSATVNQIRQLSSSEESDAMALAMAVMKDVNLSVRVLKLANTPLFNPNNREIASLSRAVVLLGFERILNLAMTIKLVESLRAEKADKILDQLLLHAFLNASIARELAEAANLRKAEGVYLNGLLHNLGEILVAYTLPDAHEQIRTLYQQRETSWSEAQLRLLGAEFSDIGQAFAESWGFPRPMVESMDRYTANKLLGRDRSAHQIAVGSSEILTTLYQTGGQSEASLGGIFSRLAEQLNVRTGQVEDSVHQAFKLAAHLAQEIGVPTAALKPNMTETDDSYLCEFIEDINFFLHSRDERQRAESPSSASQPPEQPRSGELLTALAKFIKATQLQPPATLLVEEAINSVLENSGFERGLLLLPSASSTKQFNTKLSKGHGGSTLAAHIDQLTDRASLKLLQAILSKGSTLMVADLDSAEWRTRLPQAFLDATQARGLVLSSLSARGRGLGLLYFDTQTGAVQDTDYAVLNQFMLLLSNALESRAQLASN